MSFFVDLSFPFRKKCWLYTIAFIKWSTKDRQFCQNAEQKENKTAQLICGYSCNSLRLTVETALRDYLSVFALAALEYKKKAKSNWFKELLDFSVLVALNMRQSLSPFLHFQHFCFLLLNYFFPLYLRIILIIFTGK